MLNYAAIILQMIIVRNKIDNIFYTLVVNKKQRIKNVNIKSLITTEIRRLTCHAH